MTKAVATMHRDQMQALTGSWASCASVVNPCALTVEVGSRMVLNLESSRHLFSYETSQSDEAEFAPALLQDLASVRSEHITPVKSATRCSDKAASGIVEMP